MIVCVCVDEVSVSFFLSLSQFFLLFFLFFFFSVFIFFYFFVGPPPWSPAPSLRGTI